IIHRRAIRQARRRPGRPGRPNGFGRATAIGEHVTQVNGEKVNNKRSAFSTPGRFYRTVSIAEAVTWTVLIVGMLLKYVAGLGSLPVLIGGSIHGFVFLSFAGASLLVGVNQRWPVGRIVAAVAMAIVPYGTIPFDSRLVRRGALEGPWHAEHSGET